MNKLVTVSRLEIVDHTKSGTGRDFVKWLSYDFDVDYDVQDNGKIIKIFLKDMPAQPERN